MEAIQEIVQGMIEFKKVEIPLEWIKHSFKESGVRWSKNIEQEFLSELAKQGKPATIETYPTHIIHIRNERNNRYFKLN